jgi:hypothetical protein
MNAFSRKGIAKNSDFLKNFEVNTSIRMGGRRSDVNERANAF